MKYNTVHWMVVLTGDVRTTQYTGWWYSLVKYNTVHWMVVLTGEVPHSTLDGGTH